MIFDVNELQKNYTALHLACLRGREQTIMALAERGANLDAKNEVSSTSKWIYSNSASNRV